MKKQHEGEKTPCSASHQSNLGPLKKGRGISNHVFLNVTFIFYVATETLLNVTVPTPHYNIQF